MMTQDPIYPDPEDFLEDETAEESDDETAGISLADLHEEMVATSSEARRGTRRMLDILKNFGGVLDAMSATVSDTHKAVKTLPTSSAAQVESNDLPREWTLALVELTDRIERVANGFSRPPAPRAPWWQLGAAKAQTAWSQAWTMQAEALSIVRSHGQTLLSRASLERLVVVGRLFDPHTMTAVEFTSDASQPDHTVLAEILPGWRHSLTGQLLRPAQVRVSRTVSHESP
jgi:hypothetical protein